MMDKTHKQLITHHLINDVIFIILTTYEILYYILLERLVSNQKTRGRSNKLCVNE